MIKEKENFLSIWHINNLVVVVVDEYNRVVRPSGCKILRMRRNFRFCLEMNLNLYAHL